MNRLLRLVVSVLIASTVNVTSYSFVAPSYGADTVLSSAAEAKIAEVIASAPLSNPSRDRIVAISSHFLGAPYISNTLSGGSGKKERLVVELWGFDCFTFLDTVEALRRTNKAEDFADNLIAVRYKDGNVSYLTRRHFFSDWVADQGGFLFDLTRSIAPDTVRQVKISLNQRTDGSLWVPGVPVLSRVINYIPSSSVDTHVLNRLRNGDYIGFYTSQAGLDVTHTGLIVKDNQQVLLRHASSRKSKDMVRDEDLKEFMRAHDGLIVYRAREGMIEK